MPKTTKFHAMNKRELLAYCSELVEERGISVLRFKELSGIPGLYGNLYAKGLPLKTLVKELGLEEEYEEYRDKNWCKVVNGKEHRKWTWIRVLRVAQDTIEQEGFLPPAEWFFKHGQSAFVAAIYSMGRTWEELRTEFDSFTGSGNPREAASTFYQPRDSSESLGTWRDRLTPEEIARVETATRDVTRRLYPE